MSHLLTSVFLAINTVDNNKYAIKTIDKSKIIEEDLLNNIKNEIMLMKMIKHPYIVGLIEVMATASKIILVLEYIEGCDLFDLIGYVLNRFAQGKTP